MILKNMENKMKILAIILALFLCACSNQNKWIKVSETQFKKGVFEISGDFDGDSLQDNAYLANKDNKLALVTELSSKGFSNQYVIDVLNNVNIENIGIELNPKNSSVLICAKDCEHKEQKKPAFDAIVFFEIESSRSIFIYNHQKGVFDEFWLSD